MSSLAETIAATAVRPGSVMAWWLSGTGFIFKTSQGTQIYVDPYFSNCVAQIFGIERAVPPPVPVGEAAPDLVIATHWHEDHLDPEGLPELARRSPTHFLCPPSCKSRLLGWLVPGERINAITEGETYHIPRRSHYSRRRAPPGGDPRVGSAGCDRAADRNRRAADLSHGRHRV